MLDRRLKRLLVAVLMIGVFVGVPVYGQQVTLEVLLTERDPNRNIVQDYGDVSWTAILAEEFMKQHPDIKVEFRYGTLEQATVMIASGIGPDIVNGAASGFTNLGRAGAFIDLNPLMDRDGIDFMADETYWPPQWEAYEYMGRHFALPQYLGTTALFYNADMFADAGLVDPDPNIETNTMDWEELEAISKRLTRDHSGDGVIDVWGFHKALRTNRVGYWLKAAGAEYYGNEERTVSALDTPEAMRALEFLQELRWQAGVLAPPGVTPRFLQGEAAIAEEGSWTLVNYLGLGSDGYPKVSFGWNLMPAPLGPSGQRGALATIDGYAINRNTQHVDAAWELLKFLAGPEANAIKAKYLGLQPSHRDVVPEYIGLMRELNRNVYDIDVHVFTDAGAYASPQINYAQQDLAAGLLNEAYEKIFDRNESVGSVWPEMVGRLNRILALNAGDVPEETVVWQDLEWKTRDFGSAVDGATLVQDDQLTLLAGGNDIWGTRDGFRYVYQEVEGDFTVTVRLESVPDTNNWSKAGIMLRVEETGESPNAAVLGTLANGVVMQERLYSGASSRTAGRTSWTSGRPVYLRLDRSGNTVRGYMSVTGTSWTELSVVNIDLPNRVYIGVAATSHVAGVLGDAIFADWNLVRN